MSLMRCLGVLLGFGLFLCAPQVWARDGLVVSGTEVDTLLQAPHESTQDFQVRVFQRLRDFTRQTGFEAAGSFCRNKQGQMGILIFTWHAYFSAPYMGGCPIKTPDLTGEFVHSHPLPGTYLLTQQDVEQINRSRWLFKIKQPKKMYISLSDTQRFSKNDYEVGDGFLVSDGVVFYQNGKGTQEFVMRLP